RRADGRGRRGRVGWWQPPARGHAARGPGADPGGHGPSRDPLPGRVRRRAPQPGRAGVDALTAPVGPALRGAALAELDRASQRRPTVVRLLPRRLRGCSRRRLVLVGLGLLGTAVLAPVLLFALGYLAFAVPTPDEAVNNQV